MLPVFSQPALLEGLAVPEVVFNVYHDESGTYSRRGGDRWLLHGVLFVPESRQEEIFQAMQRVREQVGYYEEVHHAKLRQSVRGPKASCARGWLRLYVGFSDYCFYHCLAIDTHSPGFEHDRFGKPYQAYNRFARMAIEGGIAWSLRGYRRVALRLFSDAKFRQRGDNFSEYIPRELDRSMRERRRKRPNAYPEVRLLHPEVIPVESDPSQIEPDLVQQCELIQLVDLLTSSVAQALRGSSGQRAKIALAEMVGQWIEDTRRPPWLQTQGLHRRFSVSCFPDEHGGFYTPLPAVRNERQMLLFRCDQEC